MTVWGSHPSMGGQLLIVGGALTFAWDVKEFPLDGQNCRRF